MNRIFRDRKEAGHLLAERVKLLPKEDLEKALILALPRGGVVVGSEVSAALKLPLEVLVVRKIGHPLQPEYGIGAIAEGGFYWIDPDAIGISWLPKAQLDALIEKEKLEIERRVNYYRKGQAPPSLAEKVVIIVDDGVATGVTARVAASYAKAKAAAKVILAAPACSESTAKAMRLKSEFDDVICLIESSAFLAVGLYFQDFEQVSDEEVVQLLSQARTNQLSKESQASLKIQKQVVIPNEAGSETPGLLDVPKDPKGIVIFAHGSGSGRLSPRNQQVAKDLNQAGIATLLFDLLTDEESQNRNHIFNIPLLAKRLISATLWTKQQDFGKDLAISYFGASTGAGAALAAAADLKDQISAVVSRGGRPDLAMDRLKDVHAPTLLLVGDRDSFVISLNQMALKQLERGHLILIPGATHLFEEPGTLEQVSEHAKQWFLKYFSHSPLKRAYRTSF